VIKIIKLYFICLTHP